MPYAPAVWPCIVTSICRAVRSSRRSCARACWLWTGRSGILAGHSASALYGARWVDSARNAEVIHDNRHRQPGITIWSGDISPGEICVVDGMRVTTVARTALDLACRHPRGPAVAAIDALCRATELKTSEMFELASRHGGMRGIRRARAVFDLVDAGAQSPKETWLRLLLRDAGLPPVTTQILVHNGDFVASSTTGTSTAATVGNTARTSRGWKCSTAWAG